MKVSPEQWREAQARWEADPEMQLLDVAKRLGVSAPSVTQYAQRHGWSKLLPPVSREHMAQAAADVLSHISNRTELVEQVSTVLDLSVATRVQVLNQHRQDWAEHRRLFPSEALASDPSASRRCKLSAESIAIRQRGEAIAFGLTTFNGADTAAPLVELVEAETPKADWERLLESYVTTGKAPPEFHKSTFKPRPEVEPDPFADEPHHDVRLLPGIPPELGLEDDDTPPPSQH